MQLPGIHHVTAISARIRDNHHFYTRALGMRLVKRSVNQDDVSSYHLFYADARGSPGTDLTFFDWPAARERRGTNALVRVGLRVAGRSSLEYWAERLRAMRLAVSAMQERAGRWTLDFEDAEGQRLTLVNDDGIGDAFPWSDSPVPAAHQIRGLGPVTMSVPELAPTDDVLQCVLGMRPANRYPCPDAESDTVHVYEMGAGGAAAELHVAVQPSLPRSRQGAGAVHHVAFRTPDDTRRGPID